MAGFVTNMVKTAFSHLKQYVFIFLSGHEMYLGIAQILLSFFSLLCH